MSRSKLKALMPVALKKFEKFYKVKYKRRHWHYFKEWMQENENN